MLRVVQKNLNRDFKRSLIFRRGKPQKEHDPRTLIVTNMALNGLYLPRNKCNRSERKAGVKGSKRQTCFELHSILSAFL